MEALELYKIEVAKLAPCADHNFSPRLALYRAGDEQAGRELTGSCLGMVLALVESLPELPAGLDLLETVQEANAGLVEALRTFSGTTVDEFADHARRTIHTWLNTPDVQG